VGVSDSTPTALVSVALALADKFDALTGFFAAGEKPTGSGDPFALRRATLGAIRIILDNGLRLPLLRVWGVSFALHFVDSAHAKTQELVTPIRTPLEKLGLVNKYEEIWDASFESGVSDEASKAGYQKYKVDSIELLTFFADRLKVQLRDQGARHDLVDAVFSLGGQDDLLLVVRRVEALGKFLDTDDGKNLLAGTKRASNILAIEEKKDKRTFDGAPDAGLYRLPEEKALASAIDQVKSEAGAAVQREDFATAMSAMAKLRPAVDAFFDKVKVNDDEPKVRENRLKLLNEIRAATRAVADFSKIEG